MDRKEPEIEVSPTSRDRESLDLTLHPGFDETPSPAPGSPRSGSKHQELLRQGEALFASGWYQGAVHVWTRVLFLDRGNPSARKAIEKAKRALAEQQRLLDAEIVSAGELLGHGSIEAARNKVTFVLGTDPRHSEARTLLARLDAMNRRAPLPRHGILTAEPVSSDPPFPSVPASPSSPASRNSAKTTERLRVGGDYLPPTARAAARTSSSLRMAAFLIMALLLFVAGGLYLSVHWDQLVSDGPFAAADSATSATAAAAVEGAGDGSAAEVALAHGIFSVPSEAELHYFNGARLFSKGRYREALAELSRVDRRSSSGERARSLILRIEERLLRGAQNDDASDVDTNQTR